MISEQRIIELAKESELLYLLEHTSLQYKKSLPPLLAFANALQAEWIKSLVPVAWKAKSGFITTTPPGKESYFNVPLCAIPNEEVK